MFEKILIANRGEIALRIIRTCKELGIKTVAVYSEADEQSLHVQLADGAICIGPAQSSESYLKPDRIISAAEIADVDAIHPGYGFLAEKAEFAEQCESCNINFIGPPSDVISKMGDKSIARETIRKSRIPVIPGSEGTLESRSEALKIAQKIGFPVIIKAVAGGGGKGMRLARNAMTFSKEFDTLHLGERDCSVQRRYQKQIEEAPSPFLTPDLRKKMGRYAIRAAEACNYVNAGTIEFLVDKDGNYYFIEMNTRIQVEHGVTEEVTGIDLIKEQILIAAGESLKFDQRDIKINQHAIETRICAEDPDRNFSPSPGEITLYYQPGGQGVRVDTHIYGGYYIPTHYDSMIGKLITTGKTRDLALDRMHRALGEYIIRGVKTTIPFNMAVVNDPIFRRVGATTNFIDEFLNGKPKNFFNNNTH